MVRSLAAEAGPHGITVNAIAPGIIETPQILNSVNSLGAAGIAETARNQPVRRAGRPDDIAAAYHFLASDDAAFVTGHVLLVDGGPDAHPRITMDQPQGATLSYSAGRSPEGCVNPGNERDRMLIEVRGIQAHWR